MENFLDALLAAIPEQDLILFPAIDIGEEEIVVPQDGLAEPVLQPVLQNPDEYLMPRRAPFEELPNDWEVFSGLNYLGVQQHLQEELDAPEQEEDMADNEEEDSDDEGAKASSQDVDAKSSASQLVTKRDASITDDDRLLRDIGSSSSSLATFSLEDPAMPGASPAAFGPVLESVPRIRNPHQ